MSIAIDAFRLVCERHTSGANYATQLSRALADCDHVDRVLMLVPMTPEEQPRPHPKVRLVDVGVDYDPSARFRYQVWWVQGDIPRVLWQLRRDIDYFVAPYHNTPFFAPRNVTVATVVHDLCGLGPGYPRTGMNYYRHLAMLLSAAIRANAIVPISQYTRDHFAATFSWARNRLTPPVHNGIDDPTLGYSDVEEALEALSLGRGDYFIGIAAGHPRKGTDLLLAAFQGYRARGGAKRLVLLGGEANRNLVHTYLPSDLHGEVELLPAVSDHVRNALYAGAVALVFPSRCEGFGYPLLEAMRQGCPVLASSDGPASEIVNDVIPLPNVLDPTVIAGWMKWWDDLDSSERSAHAQGLVDRSLVVGKSFGTEFIQAIMSGARWE